MAPWHHITRYLSPCQKSGVTGHFPNLAEQPCGSVVQRKLYIAANVANHQIQRPNLGLDLGKDVLDAVLIAGIQRIAIGPAPSVG